MTTVAVSFTSESGDRYLSLFTDVGTPAEFVSRLEEEYGEEFSYLRVDAYASDDVAVEGDLIAALREALWAAQESQYD